MFLRVFILVFLVQTTYHASIQGEDEHYYCPTPVAPEHGKVIGTDYEMGSYIIIECDPGYYLTGMRKVYCVPLPNPFKKMAGWDNVVGQNPECHRVSRRKRNIPGVSFDMEQAKSITDDEGLTKLLYTKNKKLGENKKDSVENKLHKHHPHKSTSANGETECSLEVMVGPCRGRLTRYYYDIQDEQCKMFHYGGCRGNANNFKSMKDCKETCEKQK